MLVLMFVFVCIFFLVVIVCLNKWLRICLIFLYFCLSLWVCLIWVKICFLFNIKLFNLEVICIKCIIEFLWSNINKWGWSWFKGILLDLERNWVIFLILGCILLVII